MSRRLLMGKGYRHGAIGGGGYVGPGDITAGALVWGGLSAYNAAYATPGNNPSIGIVDQAGSNPLTANILSDGYLDIATINAWVTAHSVTAIRVTEIYDQTGNGQHFFQFTIGNMPQLIINPAGLSANRATMLFSSARSDQIVSAGTGFTSSQPFTISTVARRTIKQTSVRGGICSIAGGGIRFGYEANADTFFQYAGSGLNDIGTGALNTWHALQAVFAGGASVVNVNGVDSSPNNPGSASPSSSSLAVGTASSGDYYDGYVSEIGVYSGSVGAIGANQKTRWGF